FAVVAEPQEEFDAWLAMQRQEAAPQKTERQKRGREVFLTSTCIMCHQIQGTSAQAQIGPDLTHIASRPLIGGMLENNEGNLGGWISDPQQIKPGVRMPPNPLPPEDLRALLVYLSSLK